MGSSRWSLPSGPRQLHLFDDPGLQRLGLDGEGRQALRCRHARRLERDQRRFGDPKPVERSHRTLIPVDEAIRSGRAMGAGLLSLRGLDPASITVAATVRCQQAHDWLRPLADRLVLLQPVQQLQHLSDWFAALPPLGPRQVIALLRSG